MKKNAFNKSRLLGHFSLENGQKVFGDLRLRGPKSSLRLRDATFIHVGPQRSFHGELHDLQKVSCMHCIELSSGNTWSAVGGTYHYANIFPHFVTIGAKHLDVDAAVIKSIHFTVGDIAAMFYDFDAFGHVTDAGPLIQSVLAANEKDRSVNTGERPLIAYFTGKEEVVSVNTVIGRFSVRHWISYGRDGQPGVELKSQMMVSIEPESPIDFDNCISTTISALRFLSLLAGRKQGVESMSLVINTGSDEDTALSVRWSHAPKGHKQKKENPRAPHPIDIPLDAVGRPEEFSKTLANWLARDTTWRLARSRFDDCLRKGNLYDVDRLVSAANMFDLIPQVDAPAAGDLSAELVAAKASCTTLFKALPISLERDSVLGALSRIGKPSLPKKVLYRVEIVNRELRHKFPELELVAKTAIKCRNYFVHGGTDNFDYLKLQSFVPFLTSALEFVFATSDLIDAGWDARAWGARSYTSSHSFTRFRHEYGVSLQGLKEAMGGSS